MTLISSQSDIWADSYDQNTGGRPNSLTECLDSQLQPPFQNNAESFRNKAASGRCSPEVRTDAAVSHISVWEGNPISPRTLTGVWTVSFERMHLNIGIFSKSDERADKLPCRPDGCNFELFEASRHWRGPNGITTLFERKLLTDESPDP
jgi:hypothetical protein